MAFYKSPPFRTENAPCFVAKDSRTAIVSRTHPSQGLQRSFLTLSEQPLWCRFCTIMYISKKGGT